MVGTERQGVVGSDPGRREPEEKRRSSYRGRGSSDAGGNGVNRVGSQVRGAFWGVGGIRSGNEISLGIAQSLSAAGPRRPRGPARDWWDSWIGSAAVLPLSCGA
eukprot:762163-Hanusia_phi.AAC.1